MKLIYDYFNEEIDYPQDICDNILPYNTVLCEVSNTLLDGFINYVKPLACYVLDSYVDIDEQIEKDRAHVSLKNDRYSYFYFHGTKMELIGAINLGILQITHTKLSMFGDDIVILSKIAENKYMFFWYHMSGRCDIGRIMTTDSDNLVIQSVFNWLDSMVKEGTTKGFNKLNINNFFEGWISF
jgi:hypothetical protein